MKELDITTIDPAMAARPANTDGLAWHLPFEAPMELFGAPFFEQNHTYHRLPLANRPDFVTQFPKGIPTRVPATECGAFLLSENCAGLQVRFRTDSTQFVVHAVLAQSGCMDHMPWTGISGFDVYLRGDGEQAWQCFGVTRVDIGKVDFSAALAMGLRRRMRDVIIHFPLYNGVKSMSVGLDGDAVVEPPTPFDAASPVVFYGTSITQGGCASRPGMASTNILSRLLNREVINMGFSGSGRGEPEIAAMLAEIPAPAAYVLDHIWNTDESSYRVSLPQFINILRARHPDVPILVLSATPGREFSPEFAVPTPKTGSAEFAEAEVARRRAAGDSRVFYYDVFHEAMGGDALECLVDGCHMTDLGFYRFANALAPVLRGIL